MILLSLLLLGLFIGVTIALASLSIKIINEFARQLKVQQKANKIRKENKTKQIDVTKLKGKEKKLARIENQQRIEEAKKVARKEAEKLNPSLLAKERFEEEFGHEYGARGTTNSYKKALRYQELKKEAKLEIKAKKLKG